MIPSDDHEFPLSGPRLADVLPDVHREDGRGRVEYGGECADEAADEDGHHEPPQPDGHQPRNEYRVGRVRTAAGPRSAADALADGRVDAGDLVRVQNSSDHP